MATTVFDVLTKQIEDATSSATEFLENGSATDYANYREVVGLIRGLQTSLSFVKDLSRNYMDDDND
jgi:hypothetical protein|tara:strand:- start:3087 stop:3284 length:198 start_codon:yes stop_codon:yes gene_type:complete